MKKIHFICFLSLFLCLFACGGGSGGSSSSGSTATYTITIQDAANHLVHIKAHFTGFSGSSATMILSTRYDDLGRVTIDNAVAKNAQGVALAVAQTDYDYNVTEISGGDFSFEYDLTMNQLHANNGSMGFLGEHYLLTATGWSLAVPAGMTMGTYRVKFDAYSDWEPVTPWTSSGDEFVETDASLFTQATFAMGNFDVQTQTIAGTTVTVAMDERFDADLRSKLASGTFVIFSYIKDVFGAAGPDKHLTIATAADEASEYQWFNENGSSHGDAFSNLESAFTSVAHRVFHTYNGFEPEGMSIEPGWFLEGADEYFTMLAFVAADFIAPFWDLSVAYDVYVDQKDEYDASLANHTTYADWDEKNYLIYNKGSLVALFMDQEIRSATGGASTLADLMTSLYAHYGQFQGTVTADVLLEEFSAIAGSDMTWFFDKYVKGTDTIDLSSDLADADFDGIPFIGEALLGTSDTDDDTDGDLAADDQEFRAGTDPLLASSVADAPLFVDGFDADWAGVASTTVADAAADAPECGQDITEIRCYADAEALYLLYEFSCLVALDTDLAYFMNFYFDGVDVPTRQFYVSYPGAGATFLFDENLESTDYHSLTEVTGAEADVATSVEFKFPLALVTGTSSQSFYAGVWNNTDAVMTDSIGWIRVTGTGCANSVMP